MLLTPDVNEQSCPIWDGIKIVDLRYPYPEQQNVYGNGGRFYSSRAGGPFLLIPSGAALLDLLTVEQKVNLSYWIYKYNLENHLFDELSNQDLQDLGWFSDWMNRYRDYVLVMDQTWVEANRDRTPSSSDRMLTFLRESIRDWDAGEGRESTSDLKKAAGGCRNDEDLRELQNYAAEQGWMGVGPESSPMYTRRINLSARIHVEEQLGEQGRGQQAFVAMWFDPSMNEVYACGIKPAIEEAGYEARRIDHKEFVGGVVDEIVAEIRKSRFVVADFTTSRESGDRGGVYYEAGFAFGLGIPVIHTCREDCKKAVHFDTSHLNHLFWEDTDDLREKLQNRIEAVLGRGPLKPATESGRTGSTLNENS